MNDQMPMRADRSERVRVEDDVTTAVIDGVPHKFVYLGFTDQRSPNPDGPADRRLWCLKEALGMRSLIFPAKKDEPESEEQKIQSILDMAQKFSEWVENEA